jgi:predicted O-linked N-acetylglucosamine transferase (SPINDLY family)
MPQRRAKPAKEIARHFEAALTAHQAGDAGRAIAAYREVLALDPGHSGALTNLALLLRQSGDSAAALTLLERATRASVAPAALWYNFGNLLQELNRHEDAERAFRRALKLDPRLFQAATHLARLLAQLERRDEAMALHRQALEIEPRNAVSLRGLGQLSYQRGDIDEAERLYRAALEITPDHPETLNALGVVLKDRGAFDEALSLWRRAIELAPDYAIAHNNLGVMLRLMRRPADALGPLRTAVKFNPADATAAGNLAHALLNLGRTTDAEDVARDILARDPANAEGHLMLGFALAYQARVEEAIDEFLFSLRCAPGTSVNISNALFASQYSEIRAPAEIGSLHRELSIQIPPALPAYRDWRCGDRADRPLRVGYLSPDMRVHPVSTFFEPIIANHDRERFEIHCYSTTEAPDDVTRRLQAYGPRWHQCAGRPDKWIAEHIHADGIDILVDLAGHTSGNRAAVLRARPAPVQALFIGYPGTSGMPEVDYLIADGRVCPPEHDALYSEKVVRLDGSFWCFRPPDAAPEPATAPFARNGYVTFGSYNAAQKISDRTVRLWSDVLRAVPRSRLLLKSLSFADEKLRTRFRHRFLDAGVEAARIDVLPPSDRAQFYAEYRHLDIALDPVPYNGGTTTCEALWLGVPVIALRGDLFRGRMAAAILEIIGLPDLAADTNDGYVAAAARLAEDPRRIAALHAGLRDQVARSPLCDGARAARELEQACTWMHRHSVR